MPGISPEKWLVEISIDVNIVKIFTSSNSSPLKVVVGDKVGRWWLWDSGRLQNFDGRKVASSFRSTDIQVSDRNRGLLP
ncbi:hypothetical protein L2E82_25184 [Cichorium intybus]|uniref:Uncharacterized protein n=1 Tax=Cichorium intybus TaxID=13427 RepID=A0ACB9E2L1_CICIN|nr:hypothetical protein L2E82_25184 [Cichorium intybus]